MSSLYGEEKVIYQEMSPDQSLDLFIQNVHHQYRYKEGSFHN